MSELTYHPDAVVVGLIKPDAYEKLCALVEQTKHFHPPLGNPSLALCTASTRDKSTDRPRSF